MKAIFGAHLSTPETRLLRDSVTATSTSTSSTRPRTAAG